VCKTQTPHPGRPAKVCTTGIVKPTFLPKPPLPPAVIPSIGAEGDLQYTDGAFNSMRPPTYSNGSAAALNSTSELDAEGWPKMDCQITIFDGRPAHAWAPPMDDPERRQADYSGTWTLVLTGNATVSLVNAAGIMLGEPASDHTFHPILLNFPLFVCLTTLSDRAIAPCGRLCCDMTPPPRW
jgi:hypothetical protein